MCVRIASLLSLTLQVKAVDLDTGANGNVTYSLVKSTDQSSDRFDIDTISGIIRTADVFDREAQIGVTDYGVTVKAEDQGSPTLAGFCTFRSVFKVRLSSALLERLHILLLRSVIVIVVWEIVCL